MLKSAHNTSKTKLHLTQPKTAHNTTFKTWRGETFKRKLIERYKIDTAIYILSNIYYRHKQI